MQGGGDVGIRFKYVFKRKSCWETARGDGADCFRLVEREPLNLNILLNTTLNGLSIHEINLGVVQQLKRDAGEHRDLIENILKELSEAFSNDEDLQIYTSGATNVFKYPELTDGESASRIIDTFEKKEKLR